MADKEKELTEEELKKAAGGIKPTQADPGQLQGNPSVGRPKKPRERHE